MADEKSAKHTYDESKVKTLSSIEHIRLRTGMYIGRIGTGAHDYTIGVTFNLNTFHAASSARTAVSHCCCWATRRTLPSQFRTGSSQF